MWFLFVLTILVTGEKEVKVFQVEGKVTCYSKAAQTDRVLSHKNNNVRAYHIECVKAENT